MNIAEYMDVAELIKHIQSGMVDRKRHETLPLNILTYSRNAVWEDHWDDITCKCRGLIVDDDGNIISRPFEKFFNLDTSYRPETWVSNLPPEKPQIQEKLDGSLGILYEYKGVVGIASKGSFHSEHANWATKWYLENCKEAQWPDGYTPVFEMICQEVQTHVVRYDTQDQLVLIALVNKTTGEEASYENLHYWGTLNKVAVVDTFDKSLGTVLNEDRPNAEGYVLTWSQPGKSPLKIKIKHESFLALQKIVHSATPKTILQALIDGREDELESWMATTSPELNQFVKGWFARFAATFGNVLVSANQIVSAAKMRCATRKEIAEFFNSEDNKLYASVCFAMLDEKDYKKAIWKIMKDLTKDDEDIHFLSEEDEVEDHDTFGQAFE